MSKKIKVVLAIMLCVILVLPLSAQSVQAKNVSKKSVTVTLNSKKPFGKCSFKLTKTAKMKVTIKILSVSGKAEEKEIYIGEILGDQLKDSLFYKFKTSKLKKNKTFTSNTLSDFPCKYGDVFFELPKGMKSMKIKVTFSSPDGKKVIKSLKKS